MDQNDKDIILLKNRFKELASLAYYKNICTYTDFLNLNEISIFYYVQKELPPLEFIWYGGYPPADRKILCFKPKENSSDPLFPLQCVKVSPLNPKFSDTLTHRDFLGAILNLGTTRSKVGDILVDNHKDAYIFCDDKLTKFFEDNLFKVKHTNVSCVNVLFDNEQFRPTFEEITGSAASFRLDAIIALAFNGSRSTLSNLISSGKVFVNGKLILSNSYILKEEDIVSVRGLGKFIYKETINKTKKGRYFISLLKYT